MAFVLLSHAHSLLLLLAIPSLADALQSRAPHGLAFENPMAFPPSAIEFFHPTTVALPPAASSPLPLASSSKFYPAATSARVRADEGVAAGILSSPAPTAGVGANGVAIIALGLALVVLAAVAVVSYAVVVKRRSAGGERAKAIVQPADA